MTEPNSPHELTEDNVRAILAGGTNELTFIVQAMKIHARAMMQSLRLSLLAMGVDSHDVTGAYVIQSLLNEVDRTFIPVTRDQHIDAYDYYHRVLEMISSNPSLRQQIMEDTRPTQVPGEEAAPVDPDEARKQAISDALFKDF
jgi:hypothetical protein